MSSLSEAPIGDPFEPSSLLSRFLTSPLKLIAQTTYHVILYLRGPVTVISPSSSRIRLVCISDTHTQKLTSLPHGDVLIHAGDLTNTGTVAEIQAHIDWLSSLPFEHKVVIAGNHDSYLDPRSRSRTDSGKVLKWGDIHYLQHASVRLHFPRHGNRYLSLYGSPSIPSCGGRNFAFQYARNEDVWSNTVPRETDILITHTPPRHHLDLSAGLGCDFLLKEVWRVRPKIHVFGHVHAGHGYMSAFWDESQISYEKLCDRVEKGFLRDILALSAWLEVLRLLIYGTLGVLWSRVWGGDGGTIMLNAALAYRSTGQLRNPAQVVEV